MNIAREYFMAERYESVLFIAVGLVAVILSIYWWTMVRKDFYTGMGISLASIAAIQIIVGTTIFLRSPQDLARVERMIKEDPPALVTDEIPRMQTVMQNFAVYRYVELTLLLAGILLMFGLRQRPFWNGLGLGLFMQAAVMLSLDFFAEKRGLEYLEFLRSSAMLNEGIGR